jgi:hypothetical protein
VAPPGQEDLPQGGENGEDAMGVQFLPSPELGQR